MTRPIDPLTLIYPPNPGLPPEWEGNFAGYKWFYAAGWREVWIRSKLSVDTVKQYRRTAVRNAPATWKKTWSKGEWGSLSGPQVDHAAERRPMRYDKACLAILTLELAMQGEDSVKAQMGESIDIYDYISLRPAVFKIDGFDAHLLSKICSDTRKINGLSLIDALRISVLYPYNDLRVFERLIEGYSVTEYFAESAVKFLDANGYHGLKVRQIRDRTDGGCMVKRKKPNQDEAVVIEFQGQRVERTLRNKL